MRVKKSIGTVQMRNGALNLISFWAMLDQNREEQN